MPKVVPILPTLVVRVTDVIWRNGVNSAAPISPPHKEKGLVLGLLLPLLLPIFTVSESPTTGIWKLKTKDYR